MAQINTRIVLRNDSLANWELHSDVVLLKGEIGVAFTDEGVAKIKIGDSVSTWAELGWYTGSLEDAIASLQTRVTELADIIGKKADAETGAAATGIFAEIERIDGIFGGYYTKEETDSAITDAVSKVDHLSYKKVDSAEAIDPAAEGANKYIYLVPKTGAEGDNYDEYMVFDGVVERVGDWNVDLSGYVEKVEGQRLMTTEEGDKLAALVGIKSLSEEFVLDESGMLVVKAIEMSKVTGLEEALAAKVTAVEGERMITEDEATKLTKLVLNDDGSVGISGKVNAENVDGLAEMLAGYVEKVEGERMITDEEAAKLEALNESAEENVLEEVQINGVALEADENKAVNIPVASTDTLGVVKSSDAENSVQIAEDGTMSVASMNVDNLVQTEGTTLVLNGGSSAA